MYIHMYIDRFSHVIRSKPFSQRQFPSTAEITCFTLFRVILSFPRKRNKIILIGSREVMHKRKCLELQSNIQIDISYFFY